jgi:uncharacterized protein (DUF1800 family)
LRRLLLLPFLGEARKGSSCRSTTGQQSHINERSKNTAKSQQAKSQQAKSQQAKSQQAKSQQAKSQQAKNSKPKTASQKQQAKNSMPPARISHAAPRPACLKKRMEYARWACLLLKMQDQRDLPVCPSMLQAAWYRFE